MASKKGEPVSLKQQRRRERCRLAAQKRRATWTQEDRLLHNERTKTAGLKLKQRRNAAGLCARCGTQPKRPGRIHCEPCARSSNRFNNEVRIHSKYGITMEEYKTLLAEQGGCCAICGGDSPSRLGHKIRFSVDHDHIIEEEFGVIAIRGLLCDSCNRAIGLLGDNPGLLRKAAAYLEAEPRIEVHNGL
jgi:hypothetical protein